jgi:hypothetical protein
MATDRDRDIEIDPHFFVPPGVVDVRHENKENGEFFYEEDTRASDGPTIAYPEAVLPMPPSNYKIVNQTVRISPGGRAAVDVIIEFPDVQGIYSIDVRVTATA